MDEADLALHLSRQGLAPRGSIDWRALERVLLRFAPPGHVSMPAPGEAGKAPARGAARDPATPREDAQLAAAIKHLKGQPLTAAAAK